MGDWGAELIVGLFPISRDPPEGGTPLANASAFPSPSGFQFLGIPPKGEHMDRFFSEVQNAWFPISRDPPEGGTIC